MCRTGAVLVVVEVPARTVIDDEVVGVGCRRAGMKECRVEVQPKVEAREDRLVESDIVVAVEPAKPITSVRADNRIAAGEDRGAELIAGPARVEAHLRQAGNLPRDR